MRVPIGINAVGADGKLLLADRARAPDEFDMPDAEFYITKHLVPALQRCFTLLGEDVKSWVPVGSVLRIRGPLGAYVRVKIRCEKCGNMERSGINMLRVGTDLVGMIRWLSLCRGRTRGGTGSELLTEHPPPTRRQHRGSCRRRVGGGCS